MKLLKSLMLLVPVLSLITSCDAFKYDVIKGPATVNIVFSENIWIDERYCSEIEIDFETIKITRYGITEYGGRKFIVYTDNEIVYFRLDNISHWVID